MPLPHTAHAGGRNREPTFPQFVGDADLTERRLFDGERNDGVFDLLKAELSEVAILELTYITGTYVMHAITTRALRLEFDDVDDPCVEVPDPEGNTAGFDVMAVADVDPA